MSARSIFHARLTNGALQVNGPKFFASALCSNLHSITNEEQYMLLCNQFSYLDKVKDDFIECKPASQQLWKRSIMNIIYMLSFNCHPYLTCQIALQIKLKMSFFRVAKNSKFLL